MSIGQSTTFEERISLNNIGYTVLRYWDDDALLRTEAVLEDVLMYLSATTRAAPHPDPLPASGERENPV